MEYLFKEIIRKKSSKITKENTFDKNVLLRKVSTFDNNINNSEKEKLKQAYLPNYTKTNLLVKSMKISLLNWKYCLFTRAKNIFFDILNMCIPIQKGIIIDCITDKSKHDLLYPNFIKVVKFIIIKLIFEIIFQFIQISYINDSLYNFKDIGIEDIAKKDIEFFDLFNTSELIDTIKSLDDVFDENMIYQVLKDIQHISKIIYLAYYLLNTNFKLSLISLALILGKKISEYYSHKVSGSLDVEKFQELDDKYNNYLTDFILNIRLIKSFATERFEVNRIKKIRRKMYKLFDNPYLILNEIISSLSTIGDYFLLFFLGNLVISGKLSFGQYTIFENYFKSFDEEFQDLYSSFEQYNKYLLDWENFFELYDIKPKIISKKNYIPEKIQGKIIFDKVKFSYPLNHDIKILNNLSFSIEPGKILALVGYSNSGKSTISNLIQRFYDPNDGNIFIDNTNIKDFNLDWLHKNIGLVSQEPILCNRSIEYNITYGVNEYTMKKLEDVCEIVRVNEFLKDKRLFPEGLKTIIGERGTNVSGGQKQRIAIARAIMKDVKILIFDEATSALDAESESEVQLALDNIIKTKKITTIIIAHRLSTIRNADKILFLNKGEIIESGTHEELIKLNGEYKKLVAKQM